MSPEPTQGCSRSLRRHSPPRPASHAAPAILAPPVAEARRNQTKSSSAPADTVAMATTTTLPTSTSNASIYGTIRRPSSRQRTLRKSSSVGVGVATASTPNLHSLFNSHSRPLAVPRSLARKGSLATLTQSSLASIPDVSETYGVETVLNDSAMPPLTPGRAVPEDVAVGDVVEVPGGMQGTVRFVGSVDGKKGTFAGVELLPDFASRGKNNGDVDGCVFHPSELWTSLPDGLLFDDTNVFLLFALVSRTLAHPSRTREFSFRWGR